MSLTHRSHRLLTILMAGFFILSLASPGARPATAGDDTLRLAGSPYFETLDPGFVTDIGSTVLLRQVFRGLTMLDDQMQPVPGLAESWSVSPDGLTYRFTLRQEAVFHDGRPVEAEDVAVSFARTLDPETSGGEIAVLAGPTFLSDIAGAAEVIADQTDTLSGITVEDALTLTIHLTAPRSTFLTKLASPPGLIVDRFEVNEPDWWLEPNGSGPFMVDDFDVGDHLWLERFSDYVPAPALVERIEFRLGAGALQPLNLYEAGDIDIAGLDATQLDRVTSDSSDLSDELLRTPLLSVRYLAFRRDVAPLNDPMIRKALWLGFDRQRAAEITGGGWAVPANGILPDGLLGIADWPATMPAFDLDAARQAIADSTYGSAENVPPIPIYVSGSSMATVLQEVVREDLGLKIEVIDVEWSAFTEGLARREFSGYEMYWYIDYPDPEAILLLLFGENRPDNWIDYQDSQFNALLSQAASEANLDQRVDTYLAAQEVLLEDFVVLPVVYGVSYTVVKPYVTGFTVTPMGVLYLDTVAIDN